MFNTKSIETKKQKAFNIKVPVLKLRKVNSRGELKSGNTRRWENGFKSVL